MRFGALVLLLSSCGDNGAGGGGLVSRCTAAGDCDDQLFCNGGERCDPEDPLANTFGCVGGTPPCARGEECSEDERECSRVACDADGDGADALDCGGADCDDTDPDRFPGNAEVCDADDLDEDCDPSTVGDRNADGDAFVDMACCNVTLSGRVCGRDCDDNEAGINPETAEACDSVDNDCDGEVDEGVLVMAWPDRDGDRFGDDTQSPTVMCSLPSGMASRPGDCDDENVLQHPDEDDVCDDFDNDCDGTVDETGDSFCAGEAAGAVCFEHADGSPSDCRSVEPCPPNHYDCNGDPADGCEVDLCSDAAHCGSCSINCGRFGECGNGLCSALAFWEASGRVFDSAGTAVEGAMVSFIARCGTTVVTDPRGSFMAAPSTHDDGSPKYARITRAGSVPTISRAGTGQSYRLFTAEEIAAWAASAEPPWTEGPRFGTIVLDVEYTGSTVPGALPALFGISGGEPRVLSTTVPGGSSAGRVRIVVPNVSPGIGEIVPLLQAPSCGWQCAGGGHFFVEAGAVTYLRFTGCVLACVI